MVVIIVPPCNANVTHGNPLKALLIDRANKPHKPTHRDTQKTKQKMRPYIILTGSIAVRKLRHNASTEKKPRTRKTSREHTYDIHTAQKFSPTPKQRWNNSRITIHSTARDKKCHRTHRAHGCIRCAKSKKVQGKHAQEAQASGKQYGKKMKSVLQKVTIVTFAGQAFPKSGSTG